MGAITKIADIEAQAPDQNSLNAALKLSRGNRWSGLSVSPDGALAWGECQGSGSTPYRVVVDFREAGAKCSCPSRKFPCKHALSLMMEWVNRPGDFTQAPTEQWITEWLGRRRTVRQSPDDLADKDSTQTPRKKQSTASLAEAAAKAATQAAQKDPAELAKRAEQAAQSAKQTLDGLLEGAALLEEWVDDQLRDGLGNLLADIDVRCRAISARLADFKAQSLSGRLDSLPSRVLSLPKPVQLDALVTELGDIALLARAFRIQPDQPELLRQVGKGMRREEVLGHPDTVRVTAWWQILREEMVTLRNNLVRHQMWFVRHQDVEPHNEGEDATRLPAFALVVDFFPKAMGRQGPHYTPGQMLYAEMAFLPASHRLRARMEAASSPGDAPAQPNWATNAPLPEPSTDGAFWVKAQPLLLGPGRLMRDPVNMTLFWSGKSVQYGKRPIPIVGKVTVDLLGVPLAQSIVNLDHHGAHIWAARLVEGASHRVFIHDE